MNGPDSAGLTRLVLPEEQAVPEPAQGSDASAAHPLLPPLEVDEDGLRRGITAILFIADEPTTVGALAETLGLPPDRISAALEDVRHRCEGSGIDLIEVAGGWRLMTAMSARAVLERWIIGARHGRLTQAALETLAVVAYRQPIARLTIGEIRGVNPDGALRSLMARGLVAEVARDDGPGQAVLFGTTGQFLERMGLRTLDELPALPPYLPDGPAPDEPDAGGLSELRRRLRDGTQRLGGEPTELTEGLSPADDARLAAVGIMDDDDDDEAMPPPAPRARRPDEGEIVDLSERLEQAARSAMGRLRHLKSVQAQSEAAEDVDTVGDLEGDATSTDDDAGKPAPGEGPTRG
jgi:segregation and condensation protein B